MRRSSFIRSAQLTESKSLAVLATQVWLHTYATDGISDEIAEYTLSQITPEKYQSLISEVTSRVFVAEVEGKLVGLAVLRFGTPCPSGGTATVELQTLYVQEHFVGQGIGRALLATSQASAVNVSASRLWLTVNAQNERAISFYSRQGYAKVGTTYFQLGSGKHENHVLISPDA